MRLGEHTHGRAGVHSPDGCSCLAPCCCRAARRRGQARLWATRGKATCSTVPSCMVTASDAGSWYFGPNRRFPLPQPTSKGPGALQGSLIPQPHGQERGQRFKSTSQPRPSRQQWAGNSGSTGASPNSRRWQRAELPGRGSATGNRAKHTRETGFRITAGGQGCGPVGSAGRHV